MNIRQFSFAIIIFFITIIFSISLLAQNSGKIIGKVVDATNGEPLIGANVVVPGTEKGSATNEEGEFIITSLAPGMYNVEFSYIGYARYVATDVMVTNNKPVQLNVKLTPVSLEAEAVEVTAGYFVNRFQSEPSLISLNQEEIRRAPGAFEDVVRITASLPGVAINNAGGRNDLLVRGGGPSENLYVINNIEVPNINHFGTQGASTGTLAFINLDFVENFSFSTGGFGAAYGDKMSSVLNIEMRDGRPDRLGGSAIISATQYGLQLEGPLSEQGSFIFSARQSYLDLIFKAAGLPFVPVYTDVNLFANYELSARDQLTFLLLGAIDRIDRDVSDEEGRVVNAGILDNTQNQWIGGINYRRTLRKGYLDVTLNSNNYFYRFSQIDENLEEYFRSRADEQEVGLKVQHFWSFGRKVYLRSGAQIRFLRNRNQTAFADSIYDRNGRKIPRTALGLPGNLDNNQQAQKSALYSEIEWTPDPSLTITAGLRADYYEFLKDKFYPAPRFSLRFNLSSNHVIKASSGIYYQSPSYVWVLNPSNRNLKALKNWMTVLGYETYPRKDTRVSLEAFYKDYSRLPAGTIPGVTDYIIITNTGTEFGGRDDNFQSFGYFDLVSRGKGRAYGAELYIQKKNSEIPVFGQMSITYSRSEFTALNGRTYPAPFDQRFIFNLTGGYLPNKNWELGFRFRLFTGTPYTPVYRPSGNPTRPGFVQNLPEEYLSARLPVGHHLDLRMDRFFYFRGWTLVTYLDIQNVYNYKVPIRPRYDFWEDKIETSNAIGILPSIGIRANF